ncbi:MAG TPA: hypothetical protein VFM90_07970, partial [Cyclobacteriaceae bacterium]|nr:hypothetical protein [Cyclobacteriaceae bacterium]
MKVFIPFLIYSHVAAGAISLITAPVAMVVAKGGRAHRLAGRIFFWNMIYIFVTTVILATLHGRTFLLMVSVLSFYLVYSGYR